MFALISRSFYFLLFVVVSFNSLQSQIDSLYQAQQLDEVVLLSSRIDLPLQLNSRSIQILNSETLMSMGVVSVAEALQQFSGIDIRQRGIRGMQADLYIKGVVLIKLYYSLMV